MNKMRIIHMSDIHGDFTSLDTALDYVKDSGADVLAITGDLAGSELSEEEATEYTKALGSLHQVSGTINQISKGHADTFKAASELILNQKLAELKDFEPHAETYLKFLELVEERLRKTYGEFKQRFDGLPHDMRVLLVPGNWDGRCIEDVLSEESIDGKTLKYQGVKFAGYGGSNDLPVNALPPDLAVQFNEDEMYKFLTDSEADVVLSHVGPKMNLNGNLRNQHSSYALSVAMLQSQPNLVLHGHEHR